MPSNEDLQIAIRVLQYYGVHVKTFSNLQVCFFNCISFLSRKL